jgi:hypothetical protein
MQEFLLNRIVEDESSATQQKINSSTADGFRKIYHVCIVVFIMSQAVESL